MIRLATKVTIAGGALYVACDSGLLGSGERGSEALEKAKAAIPPAIEEWMKYFGLEVPVLTTNSLVSCMYTYIVTYIERETSGS